MALGASATNLQSRILLSTLGLTALGLALGMAVRWKACCLMLPRAIRSHLSG